MAGTPQTSTDLIKVAATAASRATPGAVFSLLKNSDTWPSWSMFDTVELEQPGADEPFGVGSIRVFSTSITRSREQVTELIPDQKLSYVLLSGLPLRNYRADMCLAAAGEQTLVSWSASFQCRPGTGWV